MSIILQLQDIIRSKLPAMLRNVGNRIRALREERARQFHGGVLPPRPSGPFTIAALARRLGVGERTLRYWEDGQTIPTARHQRALARELGVSVGDLGLGLDGVHEHQQSI
jgi:transcriptional regulator with XRE-family HTH domain